MIEAAWAVIAISNWWAVGNLVLTWVNPGLLHSLCGQPLRRSFWVHTAWPFFAWTQR